MLKTLAQVDWSNIQHCYGSAEDIPDLIMQLTSPDPDVRFNTHQKIGSRLNHQMEVYEATFYVIPVFIELLEAKDIPDRDWLIGHLGGFLNGAIMYRERNRAWGKEICEAIYQRRDFIKGLLKDFDGAVRIAAAKLLCSFEDESHTPASWIKDHIAVEEDLLVKAELAYVLAEYIERYKLNEDIFYAATFEVLEDLIGQDNESAIRFKAAINLLRLREKDTNNYVIEIIVELMSNKHTNAQIFDDRASVSYAFVIIQHEIRAEQAVWALSTILGNVEHPEHIYDATKSLLGSVFDPYQSITFDSRLTSLQREVLETLSKNNKLWEVDEVKDLMRLIYGLPETQSELVTLFDSASLSQ